MLLWALMGATWSGDQAGADITLADGDVIEGVVWNVQHVEIPPSAMVFVADGTPGEIHAVSIDIRGVLDASGGGYAGGADGVYNPSCSYYDTQEDGLGPGGGPSATVFRETGGGAGHASMGAPISTGAQGADYGTEDDALSRPPGSGGGAGACQSGCDGGIGGSGGGSIYLSATEDMVLDGVVRADADDGAPGQSRDYCTGGRGGGGSGGTIVLEAPIITGGGTISVRGGNGASGGRVKVLVDQLDALMVFDEGQGGTTWISDDNCLGVSNPGQLDTDGDQVGDLCDTCVDVTDPDQLDTDADGAGDACDLCPVDPDDGTDSDADGFGDACECAPNDPEIHPDMGERCNDLDDDCDGLVDEDLPTTTWYADDDGDGWGDPDRSVEACAAPAGHVDQAGDCDDTDAAGTACDDPAVDSGTEADAETKADGCGCRSGRGGARGSVLWLLSRRR